MGVDIVGYANATKSADQSAGAGRAYVCLFEYLQVGPDKLEDCAYYDFGGEGQIADFSHATWGYHCIINRIANIAGWPLRYEILLGEAKETYCLDCLEGKAGPFSELIRAPIHPGTLGTATSKKLSDDFAKFQPQADAVRNHENFAKSYAALRKVFETAAQRGFVNFSY